MLLSLLFVLCFLFLEMASQLFCPGCKESEPVGHHNLVASDDVKADDPDDDFEPAEKLPGVYPTQQPGSQTSVLRNVILGIVPLC